MTTSIDYQYFVWRAVPRPEREEFLNVGVVVYCEDSGDFLCGYEVNDDRLRALDPGVDLDALRDALENLSGLIRDGGTAGMARARRRGALFGWLAAPRSTLVQPGPVHGGHVAAPGPDGLADELDRLMRRHVAVPAAPKYPE